MHALRRGEFRQEPGEWYGTPKEIWDFRTRGSPRAPLDVAHAFLLANSELFALEPGLAGLGPPRPIESLGAHHLIFQQQHLGLPVHRAYVTVHMDNAGRVYFAKNRALPAPLLPAKTDFRISGDDAQHRALRALPRARRGGRGKVQRRERLWFPQRTHLVPVWRVRIARRRPAPAQEWIVYVNARTGGIIQKYDNLSAVNGRGRVFDPSPVIALGGFETLVTPGGRVRQPPPETYRTVVLRGLSGNGRLEGENVTTKPTPPKQRVRRANLVFQLDSKDRGFEEVMAYYHIDSAMRYLERLGYRGRRRIFRAPMKVDVNGTREDNSWYSPYEHMITYGTGAIDDAEDGETILHEFGHAIQDAICPDFGQSKESAAMGEGFGDYFAGSFFAEKKPEHYRNSVMSWDGLLDGLDQGADPPCERRLDEPLTFNDFKPRGDEHDNGRIWSATLWDIRRALGRNIADAIIIESHFQQDGFTTFARGARAIIDADLNLNRGAHVKQLRRIFRKRRIGPLQTSG